MSNIEERDTREGKATTYRQPHAIDNTKKGDAGEDDGGPEFDGKTYNAKKDKQRLTTLLTLVRNFMSDGLPHTFSEIREGIGNKGSEAGISARLRDLRKKKFGGMTVIRRRRGDPKKGLWEYILVKATPETEHGEKWEGT